MDIDIAMSVSGFLFLFILVTFLASGAFGSSIGFDVNPDDKLQKINNHPNKFKISIVLVLMSAVSVIALGVMLFIAFSWWELVLGYGVKCAISEVRQTVKSLSCIILRLSGNR